MKINLIQRLCIIVVLTGIIIVANYSRTFAQVNITLTGNAELCSGESVVLNLPPTYITYVWSSGQTTSSIIVSTAGSYYATVTDGAANTFFSDTIDVSVFQPAIANAGADITACSDNVIGLGGLVMGSASSGTWVGGAGTFDPDRFALNANYTPAASEYGTVITLTLVTNDPVGPCPSDSDSVDITVLQSPAIQPFTTFYSNICPDTTFDLATIPVVDTNNTTGFITYHDDMFIALPSTVVAPPINTPTIYYIFKTTNTTPSCFDFESVVVVMEACSGCTPPTTTMVPSNVSCNGLSDGAIDLSVAGGIPPYTYQWSNGATSQDITGLTAATYTVTVTDAQPCTAVSVMSVSEPFALNDTALVSDETVLGANDGSIDLTVSGGTPAYTFLWSNAATTEDLTGLMPGTYCVTISDDNACTRSSCYTVNAGPTGIKNVVDETLAIYPNPAQNILNIEFLNSNQTATELAIRDAKGSEFLKLDANFIVDHSKHSIDISALPQGIYFLALRTDKELYIRKFVVINQF